MREEDEPHGPAIAADGLIHAVGLNRECAVVVIPRLLTRLAPDLDALPLGLDIWQDTVLLLPDIDPNLSWRNVCTGEVLKTSIRSGQAALPLGEILSHFPVALLLAESGR